MSTLRTAPLLFVLAGCPDDVDKGDLEDTAGPIDTATDTADPGTGLPDPFTETLPDTTVAELDDADYSLVPDSLVFQTLGTMTGLGFVNTVTGSIVFEPDVPGWNEHDSDAYAFEVPVSAYVRMRASWDDPLADLDFGIFHDDGTQILDLFLTYGESWCWSTANPEVCTTPVTLEPGETYYLVALGYLGTDEQAYSIALEWIAP